MRGCVVGMRSSLVDCKLVFFLWQLLSVDFTKAVQLCYLLNGCVLVVSRCRHSKTTFTTNVFFAQNFSVNSANSVSIYFLHLSLSLSLPLCFLSLSPSSLILSQFLFCDLRQSFGEMECVKAGVTPSQD